MTLSSPLPAKTGVFGLALAWTAITIGTAISPAPAQAKSAVFYTAELAAPASEARTVAGGVAWLCEGTKCVAAKGTSRPMRICRGLSREFGEVTSFTAEGEALAEDRLAKCNGK